MKAQSHTLQEQPAEGDRKVIDRELKRQAETQAQDEKQARKQDKQNTPSKPNKH